MILRVDTAPHSVENPTPGTSFILRARVRETGGPHPMGARRFSKFVAHDLIDLTCTNELVVRVHSTWITIYTIYNSCLAQPNKKK